MKEPVAEAGWEHGDAVTTREALGQESMVAVLDAGAQYGMDIEQQVKRLGHNAVRLPFDTPIEILYGFGAIIGSGGPESVNNPDAPRTDPRLFIEKEGRPPFLGICYTQQLMNHELGGKVEKLPRREDGFTTVKLGASALSANVAIEQRFIMSHGDTITELAPGFRAIAHSGELIAGIANDEEKMYGVQFHPEVSPPAGPDLLRNFLCGVAELEADYEYDQEKFIQDSILEAQEFIGDRPVILYVSGGVDSSAAAALIQLALPHEQVHCVLVDHGYMRDSEVSKVKTMLANSNINITVWNAHEVYKTATTLIEGVETPPFNQVSDPEIKRKINGDTFITIQEKMAEYLGIGPNDFVLVMGTLYTDLIESGSAMASDHADVIKTHHNDTEQVRKLRALNRVYEPWRFIQKDGVRAVGKALNLPAEIYERQPFPGPGLAIRVICGNEAYINEDNDWIPAALAEYSSEDITTLLMPIKTVGIQGDERTYGHLAVLSGTRDWPSLKQLADDIPRTVHHNKEDSNGKLEFHGVNRVAYVFGEQISEVPFTITPTFLTDDVISQIKAADAIVNRHLEKNGLDKTISQVPVVLLPVDFGEPGQRSIAIRTFKTINFKTGDIALPGIDFPEEVLQEIVDELLAIPGICRVLYDLTSKPPATTEWE